MQRRGLTRVFGVAAVMAFIAAFVGVAGALHRQTPRFVQVSDQPVGTAGRSAAWTPEFWAFEASGDVMGNGNGSPQMFFYDHKLRVLAGLEGLSQMTCGPFDPSHPSISKRKSLVVFEADGGLCALPQQNCDALATPTTGRQIFMYDHSTGLISQLTNCPGDCRRPHISGNGKSLLFETASVLIGAGGVGTVTELYKGNLRRIGSLCRQLPCGPGAADRGVERLTFGGGQNGMQSFNGKIVAFESTGDLINGGANPGLRHVYWLNTRNGDLKQISFGTAEESRNPSLNQSGRFLAWEQDIPSGQNLVSQIFVAKIRRKKITITQLTNGGLPSRDPAMSPRARRIAFTSEGDLLGLGTLGEQVYTYNLKRDELIQISGGPSGADSAMSTTASIIGFRSSEDFVSNGNPTDQFFVSNFFPSAPGDFPSPFPGTVTPRATNTPSPAPTPGPGEPANIGLALFSDVAADNGDNTVVTVIAATVTDLFGNPVPDGTHVQFSVEPASPGVAVFNGMTNSDPQCDVSRFEDATGLEIVNQPGVVHVCVIYPGALIGDVVTINAWSGAASASGNFLLPELVNGCIQNGDPCSDSNPCTVGDVCVGGSPDRACVGGTSHGNVCTAPSHCPDGSCELVDPPACQSGPQMTCPDDGNACTTDVCDTGTGTCGIAVTCADDGNACTDDVCDPGTGSCGIPNADPCEDGDLCTVGDVCSGGLCQPGPATTCPDDGNDCILDICNPDDGSCGVRIEPCACSL